MTPAENHIPKSRTNWAVICEKKNWRPKTINQNKILTLNQNKLLTINQNKLTHKALVLGRNAFGPDIGCFATHGVMYL